MGDPHVDAMIPRVSNWGRWGEVDELGTVNLITTDARRSAARLVVKGQAFSLAIPLDRDGPQPPNDARLNTRHLMLQTGSDVAAGVQPSAIAGSGYADDIVTMALQSATQWDALSHAFYDYRMYNDRDCRLVTTTGAAANAIDRLGARVAGRGVLIDVARFLGQESLSPGHEITTAELQGALESQATEIEQGDILLIRTGHMKWARRNGGWDDFVLAPEPGIGLDVLPWLHDGGVAGVAADNWALEVVPGGCSIPYPVHAAGIVHMGLLIGEMFDLESLADDCAQDGTYEFFFCAPPLPFANAVGSPVNPVALK